MQTESAPPHPPFVPGELFHELSVWSGLLCLLSLVGKESPVLLTSAGAATQRLALQKPSALLPPSLPPRVAPGLCQPEPVPAMRPVQNEPNQPFTGGQVGCSMARRAPVPPDQVLRAAREAFLCGKPETKSVNRFWHLCLQADREPRNRGLLRWASLTGGEWDTVQLPRACAGPSGNSCYTSCLSGSGSTDTSCPKKVPYPQQGREKRCRSCPLAFSPGLTRKQHWRERPTSAQLQPMDRGLPGSSLNFGEGQPNQHRGNVARCRWGGACFTGRPNRGLCRQSGFGRQDASRAPSCGNKQKGV